jgi:hypothetical protein
MIYKLKHLGLTMGAVFALCVLAAPAQGALTELTPAGGGAAVIKGEQIGTHTFTVGSRQLTCGTGTFSGEVTGNTTDFKLIPTYQNCDTKPVLGVSFPVTETMNSCYYTYTGEATVSTGIYGISRHLICDPEDKIVIHVYSDAGHHNNVCTITIFPQTSLGYSATNSAGSPDDVVFHSNNVSIQTTIHGSLCGGTEETDKVFNAVESGATTFRAFQGASQVNLTVSD